MKYRDFSWFKVIPNLGTWVSLLDYKFINHYLSSRYCIFWKCNLYLPTKICAPASICISTTSDDHHGEIAIDRE